jgi:Ca-activated chloride channel homolog
MSFLTPLGLALGALAGPILLLYMLRLRRRDVQVSSTMLWQQVLRDREANTPWQRLRRNLLLIVQLLVLAALAFALARPFMEVPTVTTGRIALLIDASASMNAMDVQPSRFEVAKQQALNVISTSNSGDTIAVIRVAEGPEVVENYTSNQSSLTDAINTMQPSQGSADWDAALTLAAAGASGAEKFTILVIGDGGVPSTVNANYGDVKFIPVGASDQNLAITALATANDPKGPQIYAQITNYGTTQATVVFSIKLDGTLFNAANYTVPAQGYTDVVVNNLPATFRRVEASLTRPAASNIPDYLSIDDTAYTVYTPASAGRVILFLDQNKFLEQGFASLPDWQSFRAQADKSMPTEKFDLYVFDNFIPDRLPDANILFVNPPSGGSLFQVGEVTKNVGNMNVRRDDPRTRLLQFSDVNIRQYRKITPASWADVLVSAQDGPLVFAGENNGRRIAVISFDLHDSDLALKIAWPILLSNLTEWYKAPRALALNGSLRPGQAVTIQPGGSSDLVRITRPDGTVTTLKNDQPSLVYADTSLPGLYTVDVYQADKVLQTEQFAVNLFDANESNITIRQPSITTSGQSGAQVAEIGQREFWPLVAVLAILLLVIEWWIYHRHWSMPSLGSVALRRFARRS